MGARTKPGPALRLVLLLALLAAAAVLPACGSEERPPETARTSGPGKPQTPAGRVEIAVLERPAADRAVLQARWETAGEHCRVDLILPEGAVLLSGSPSVVPDATSEPAARWEVRFETGRPLDAVVRLCADVDGTPMATEASVRLSE